jgi:hypothetical protein
LIDSCPPAPPETGGILGGTDDIITKFALDNHCGQYGIYRPDTVNLNTVIAAWNLWGVGFMGIFHSHFPGGTALSEQDIAYIHKIMRCMPSGIESLFFPVILPDNRVISYVSHRTNEGVIIDVEEVVLLP